MVSLQCQNSNLFSVSGRQKWPTGRSNGFPGIDSANMPPDPRLGPAFRFSLTISATAGWNDSRDLPLVAGRAQWQVPRTLDSGDESDIGQECGQLLSALDRPERNSIEWSHAPKASTLAISTRASP
jgi:hypothetical protein